MPVIRHETLSGFFTFIRPCIVINFYSKTNQMHNISYFILFWNSTLHVLDGLCPASGNCHTEIPKIGTVLYIPDAVCTVLDS